MLNPPQEYCPMDKDSAGFGKEVFIKLTDEEVTLAGILTIPEGATGIVVFAHGSGSGRFSPRNQFVAQFLAKEGLATLLMDLLTTDEEAIDQETREFRFNVFLLAKRLSGASKWLRQLGLTSSLNIGYFGSSTGAAAALISAAEEGSVISAIVSRGGRPDLAGPELSRVKVPTLFIVGGNDLGILDQNRDALDQLAGPKQMMIVPGATHLFEEPGTLEQVERLAADWFKKYTARA